MSLYCLAGIPFATIIRQRESLLTDPSAEAKSMKYITVACWKLQRCSSVRRRLCILSVQSRSSLKPLWLKRVRLSFEHFQASHRRSTTTLKCHIKRVLFVIMLSALTVNLLN